MRTIYSAIFNNLFIKIITLFLAILTWAYIAGELYKQVPEEETSSQAVVALTDKDVVVKRVPVHINLTGSPNEKFEVAIDKIRIYPSECVILGPLETVEGVSFITTEPISIEGLTKTIRQQVKLREIPGCTLSKEKEFYAVIPIIRKAVR